MLLELHDLDAYFFAGLANFYVQIVKILDVCNLINSYLLGKLLGFFYLLENSRL